MTKNENANRNPDESKDTNSTESTAATSYRNERLEGFVAQVLNERDLIINIGHEEGVRAGDRFEVLSEKPLTITDPTDESKILGVYDRPKVRVEAVDIESHMAICRTYESKTIPGGTFWQITRSASLLDSYATNPPQVVPTTLSAEKEQFPAPLSQSESYVKRGDRVRELPSLETDE